MGFIPALLGGGLVGGAVSLLTGKKKDAPAAPAAPLVPTRNAAMDAARRDDVLRRRRGAGANELTGGGAEASTGGGKTLLGQ